MSSKKVIGRNASTSALAPPRCIASLLMACCWVCAVLDVCAAGKKVMVLGIDGMDPKLLQSFVDQGQMPNFKALMAEGDFRPLQTTMPPQSPVAWSTFMTGMDPGGQIGRAHV